MAKLFSKKACVVVLDGVQVFPGENTLSADDLKKVAAHEDGSYMIEESKDFIVTSESVKPASGKKDNADK